MRTKRALYNTVASLFLQFVTIGTGLILPPLIIGTFGSETNGLLNSITQFLKHIALLEAGVGPVTKAALYKPLVTKDDKQLKAILNTATIFFKKIALIFIAYIIILVLIFPLLSETNFDWLFISSLILINAISTFFQYYFGITYSLLLQADQKLYISNLIQISTLTLNAICILILINLGSGIHIITLVSSLIFVSRPLILSYYVKKHYKIDKIETTETVKLEQKWDALVQHIANVIRSSSGVLVLTIFATLTEVSIFSVYNMVVMALRGIVLTFSSGIGAVFGSMIANGEWKKLNRTFKIYEFITSSVSIVFFTTAGLLIIPFMHIYTRNFTDANYIRPLFAYLLITSVAIYCMRTPYTSIVTASGKFRETNKGAFIEAFIGLALSVILVINFGMIGVAIGATIAIVYRMIDLSCFASRRILKRALTIFFKRIFVSIVNVFLIIIVVVNLFPSLNPSTYLNWTLYGVIIFLISSIITITLALVFYRHEFQKIIMKLKRVIKA